MGKAAGSADASPARVLVLGGTGFVGSEVAAAFVARGCRVTVLARNPAPGSRTALLDGAAFVRGDAADSSLVDRLLDRSDHVVFAVGSPNPRESNEQPVDQVAAAVRPLVTLLEALRSRPQTGLTFCSSGGTVYGEVAAPVGESSACRPISAYGLAKLTAEHWIGIYRRRYGVRARVLRIANAYGPTQDPTRGQGVVAAFLAAARDGRPGRVFGDGSMVRDYVHVADVARAAAELAAMPGAPEVVNVGSGDGHSVDEVLHMVRRVTSCPLPVERLPERDFDVHSIVLDVARLRGLVEWHPVGLEAGIAAMWADPRAATASRVPVGPQLAGRPA